MCNTVYLSNSWWFLAVAPLKGQCHKVSDLPVIFILHTHLEGNIVFFLNMYILVNMSFIKLHTNVKTLLQDTFFSILIINDFELYSTVNINFPAKSKTLQLKMGAQIS